MHSPVFTPDAPKMSSVFPQAVIAGQFVFLAGTPGLLPETMQVISTDFEEQLRQAFRNIKVILEAAGAGLDTVVKTTVFMVAGNDFAILNKVYGEVFPDNPPVRSTPQVNPFPAGMLVSVECIAMLRS
jgi:2-iminobutanoate/2-iminopropanoate deaminase